MDRATAFPDVAERDAMETLDEPLTAADTAEIAPVSRPDASPAAPASPDTPRRWRLDRLAGYATALAVIAAGTAYGVDRVMKHREHEAAERRAAAELRKTQALETAKIESLRATIAWDYKRAKRAVEAWEAHKNGREVMSPQQLEQCLLTMQIWLEKAEALHAYEMKNGHPSGECMYYYLSMPEVKPSADEISRQLRPPVAVER